MLCVGDFLGVSPGVPATCIALEGLEVVVEKVEQKILAFLQHTQYTANEAVLCSAFPPFLEPGRRRNLQEFSAFSVSC